jgi:uncharacterized protein (TIGR04255 family)
MTLRPSDLPDFSSPPVSEVSLGVQFNSLDGLLSPHLGLIWAAFKDQFPGIEQHPPLEPVFETFGENGALLPPMPRFQFLSSIPTPRVFFINASRTELLQVQRDRLYHNWRKVGEGDEYPRFETMLETFETGFRKLQNLLMHEGLGAIAPNQCEVVYVNHVTVPVGTGPYPVFQRLFKSWVNVPTLDGIGGPEDARILLRYVIRQPDGAPIGRLIVSAEPALKIDGTNVVQLTLAARGKPMKEDLAGVSEFIKIGRRHIVKGFDQLTSKEMHKEWGKKS